MLILKLPLVIAAFRVVATASAKGVVALAVVLAAANSSWVSVMMEPFLG
jgi:hypothetical protein